MKSLAKNSVYNIIYTTASILFPLMSSMYVSRVLMAEGIGKVAYAQNITSYFTIVASLGTPVYGIRLVANQTDNAKKTNQVFTQLFVINAVTTIISSAAYIVFIRLIANGPSSFGLYICAGLQLFLNFFNIDWLYRGKEEFGYITLRSILIKVLSLAAIFCFVKTKDDYIRYALITSLALCGNYIFNMVHAFRFVRFDFSSFEWRPHIKPLLILLAGIFLSTGYSMVDVTMLGTMAGEQAVGFYNNAHRAANIIVSVCTAISAVFLPRLSFYYNHDRVKMEELIDRGVQVLAFITFPAAVGIFVLAPDVIRLLYGAEFLPAAVTLQILSVLIIILSFGNLLCYQLIMATGNEMKRLPAAAMATAVNIVMNAALIPKWQENGAAIASIISEVIVNGYQIKCLLQCIRIPVSRKAMLQGLGTSLVMGAVVWGLKSVVKGTVIRCVLCPVVGVVLYFALNIVTGNEMIRYCLSTVKKSLKRGGAVN